MLKKIISTFTKILFSLIVMSILSSCFEIGQNDGTNEVLLNGSVLKGVVSQGQLSLENKDHEIIWRGASDDDGEFNSAFIPSKNHLFTLTAKSVLGGFIKCDANECEVPTSPPKIYTFGQLIPGAEIGDVTFRSALYLDDEGENGIERNVTRQVNGFSSVVINFIFDRFEKVESKEYFVEISEVGSQVVFSSFGLDVEQDVDILNLVLPDVTKENVLESESALIVSLALLNASMSMNLSFLIDFSDALVRYSSSPDDDSIKAELTRFQQALLTEAIALIVNGQVKVNNPEILDNLHIVKNNGVNFNKLNKSLNDYSIAVGDLPSDFSASSTNWSAKDFNGESHWWWVSDFNSNKEEWLQLNYLEPFVVTQVDIGLNNAYPIRDAQIQGSNDGSVWDDLVDVASKNISDSKQYVEHISLSLNSNNPYKYYRLLTQPTEAIWLEYFCLYSSSDTNDFPCESSELHLNTKASSYKFSAINVNSPEPDTWWVSDLASGKEEWLQVSYNQPVLAKQVSVVIKQDNQGVLPEIQGSNDGDSWEILAPVSMNVYPGEYMDDDGFRHFSIDLDISDGYRHYRYYSKISDFILISVFKLNL